MLLSTEKYRSRFAFVAAAGLLLVAAAAAFLVLLQDRWARAAAAAGLVAAAALVIFLIVRRAQRRERERRNELATAEARHRALLEGLPLVTLLTAPGDRSDTVYANPAVGS